MQIKPDRIEAFIDAYEKDFGERLPHDEACEIASRLLDLYMLLARPLPSELKKMKENSIAMSPSSTYLHPRAPEQSPVPDQSSQDIQSRV